MNENYIDALKEISNIGTGSAVTSLSSLLGTNIKMTVPEVRMIPFHEMSHVLGEPEEIVLATLVKFSGDIQGMMMFIVKRASARLLIDMLLQQKKTAQLPFTELEKSAFQEIGNIVSGSYLSALGTLVNKKIVPSTPYIAEDMVAAILSVPAIELSKMADGALFIESVFDGEVSGYFFMIPDLDSLHSIMESLGVR